MARIRGLVQETAKRIADSKGIQYLVEQAKPQWRNKKSPRQEVIEESGYTLDGKFYTSAEANSLARKDPNLIEKFRTATRRNGRILTNAADALLKESERKADIENGCGSYLGSSQGSPYEATKT
jgi:hypothetical protein